MLLKKLIPKLKKITSVYLLVFLCLSVARIQAASSQANAPEFERLLTVVEQRLNLMKDVAAYKYANNIAIENKQREQVVLASAIASARQHQLDPASVEPFFRLQIEIAKAVQLSWIKSWQAEGQLASNDNSIADLMADIRPKLLSLGDQLVAQIPLALPELLPEIHAANSFESHLKSVNRLIRTPHVTQVMKRELLQALLQIRRVAASKSVLANILHGGVLRVGTTGDYPPFSFINEKSGQYSGIDIDLAKNLASSLGVELHFVKTSWPGLMQDLAANKYDIGMSGISRTLQRQRTAFFSDAYSTGGKTPIVRCDAAAQLNSLNKIDQNTVRVIVNPGGTNEKFVRRHIKNAEITVYPDNTRIFEQIIANHADVMITDAIEVKLQQRLHPELCAAMPGELFTHAEKAYLMAQDIALKLYVDAWLQELEQSGDLETAFSRYLK